jgi:hypothetical protein
MGLRPWGYFSIKTSKGIKARIMINIPEYARYIADGVRSNKRPYLDARWWAFHGLHGDAKPYAAEIYFAAINLLKSEGVENAKRKPLTTLSKADRAAMRKQAKDIAAMLQDLMGVPCCVTSKPIKYCKEDGCYLQIKVLYSDSREAYIYPNQKTLAEWEIKSTIDKRILIHRYADRRFKSSSQRIAENIEVHRANLEALL